VRSHGPGNPAERTLSSSGEGRVLHSSVHSFAAGQTKAYWPVMSCRMVSLLVLAVALFPLMCGSAVSPVATASLRQTEIARVVPRELFLRLRGGGACLGLPSRWGEMDELLLNEHLGQAAANGKIERVCQRHSFLAV